MVFETERLIIREFALNDADFIFELLNQDSWKENIGDFGIKSLKEAIEYLKCGPLESYSQNGFGLWMMELKESKLPVGMCGLLKRDWLKHIDIGFAISKEYECLGYTYEAVKETLKYAKNIIKAKKVLAITIDSNTKSIKLLEKTGLKEAGTVKNPKDENLLLYAIEFDLNDSSLQSTTSTRS